MLKRAILIDPEQNNSRHELDNNKKFSEICNIFDEPLKL